MKMLAGLPQTLEIIETGIERSVQLGVQICVNFAGHRVADAAMGLAAPGQAMATDSLMVWLSSSKPITAVAIAQLWERGLVQLDDPIAKHIPDFATHGKETITIRHALTHTGGFRGVASRYDALPWAQCIAAICDARIEPNWIPGKKAGYHIASSWYILGEIVQRLSGRPFSQYVREEIFLPLGMIDSWIGMPAEQFARYGDRLGVMQQTDGGHARPYPPLNSPEATISPRPASNARGTMRELATFYQMLLNQGTSNGATILSPQTVEAIISPHRIGLFDQTFGLHVNWGLGFICNTPGEDMQRFGYGFGPHASPRAFGHGGNQSSLGMADPEYDLVVAILFNGLCGEAQHALRMHAVMKAIYEDLGLK